MSSQQTEFADFFQASWEPCLRAVVAVVGIDSSSYTCTSTPPDPNGPPDGYGQSDSVGLLYGGPGPGGS